MGSGAARSQAPGHRPAACPGRRPATSRAGGLRYGVRPQAARRHPSPLLCPQLTCRSWRLGGARGGAEAATQRTHVCSGREHRPHAGDKPPAVPLCRRPATWRGSGRRYGARQHAARRHSCASALPTAHLHVEEVCIPCQCGRRGVRGGLAAFRGPLKGPFLRPLRNGKHLQSRSLPGGISRLYRLSQT